MSQRTRTRSAGERSRKRQSLREWASVGRRRMTPTTIILLVVSVLFVYNFVVQVVRQTQLEQYRDTLEQNVIRLREENAILERSVTYYESRDYAESVARAQLGYARPGDTVMMPTFPINSRRMPQSSLHQAPLRQSAKRIGADGGACSVATNDHSTFDCYRELERCCTPQPLSRCTPAATRTHGRSRCRRQWVTRQQRRLAHDHTSHDSVHSIADKRGF